MKRNSRLALALHTLGHMAENPDQVRTSADIAAHAGTNPVVVRRVLGKLREAGLLISEKGHAGGWRLARAPQDVTLADVYLALEERLIASGHDTGHSDCSMEHALHHRVADVLDRSERRLVEELSGISLASMQQTRPG